MADGMIFLKASEYVDSCTTLKQKIAAINAVQDALLTTAMKAVEVGHITQYSLNDGQTIIQETYRNSKEITDAYNGFEVIKQMYVNRMAGRLTRLMHNTNFTRR